LLLDDKATRPAVLDAIHAVKKQARPGDLFVFSFAGHGLREGEEFYLLTHEADSADARSLGKTALSGRALRQEVADFPCRVRRLLDACHSGEIGKGRRSGTDEAARELSDVEARVAVMCAALGHESAQGKAGHGFFSDAVARALRRDPKAVYD